MKSLLLIAACLCAGFSFAQAPKNYSSAEIYQKIQKLDVYASVLYIAAHPDDENTRLLAFLANEKKYRTGYLSLTRGDGGQNLIGDEQGIDLGLIRTQELLAARRIDGAEQFFSRAYDFGFSKNPEEAMRFWDHDKILSDVVWVIRKFRPDVIITRFPTTGEGGHGHHTASAILAGEAFDAAADPTKFPDQLKFVSVWQAKRLLWNTFNFGNNNTTREDQFQMDCGTYNPLLGKSYGEIAAESRSSHKSQGFGVPAQRGKALEYFSVIKGSKPRTELTDGIDITSGRTDLNTDVIFSALRKNYSVSEPARIVNDLATAFEAVQQMKDTYWRFQKSKELTELIEACSGVFLEAVSVNQLNIAGDSLRLRITANNRTGSVRDTIIVHVGKSTYPVTTNNDNPATLPVSFMPQMSADLLQPYWLINKPGIGSFDVTDMQQIGLPENEKVLVGFDCYVGGKKISILKPIVYKYTDPVKGELYQPVQFIEPVSVSIDPSLIIASPFEKKSTLLTVTVQANRDLNEKINVRLNIDGVEVSLGDSMVNLKKGERKLFYYGFQAHGTGAKAMVRLASGATFNKTGQSIQYDHIPDIFYRAVDSTKIISTDLKIGGRRIGYISGAGDKVPQALKQMGYDVTMLQEKDINGENLKQFDAIVAGVRAYNVHEWLSAVYPVLMEYVRNGGVLAAQYNTNNSIGPVRADISPYPFTISRNRITDETAKVNFLLPKDPVLNYPNRITERDFDGWIQERSNYHAENVDPAYRKILSMKDPGESEQEGSLIVATYGKGKFVYTGLVFFRELPAGVAGAYKLFANIIAKPL